MSYNEIISSLLEPLKSIRPADKDFIALHEPCFKGQEWHYVKECLDTGWVSSVGKYVDKFEDMMAEFCGVKRAVACANGTVALQIACQLAGVKAGDEVLVPALTFIATANAVSYCGAIPHFIDSCYETLGVDPQKLRQYLNEIADIKSGVAYNRLTGRRLSAIIPVHIFGHAVDMDALNSVCKEFSIPVIEDAAESLGTYYKGRHTGGLSLIGTISFNGNKIVTTGAGGTILTNDVEIGKRAKHLTTTAKRPHAWEFYHDEVGYNYRLPNLNAALGCAQLEKLPTFLKEKRALYNQYKKLFTDARHFKFIEEPSFSNSNLWLNAILLNEDNRELRDTILKATNDAGIMTRPVWTLMPHLPMYQNCPRMNLDVAQSLENRLINIPSSAFLGVPYV